MGQIYVGVDTGLGDETPVIEGGGSLPTGSGNKFLATPVDGSSGVASLRVIADADLPTIPHTQISGLATSATTDTTSATNITTGTLPNAQVPAPTTGALGGIKAAASATSHQWVSYVDTSGTQHTSQPAFSDISGSVVASQLPNPSASTLGGVQSSTQTTHNFLTYIDTSGVPHFAQPAFTDISGLGTSATHAASDFAQTANNLSDLASVPTAITNLGGGSANGIATLDGSGKVPTSQLPASVVGSNNYTGTWNATTNSPTLVSSTGTKGVYYIVATAGTTTIDGVSRWEVGDWIVFDGTKWDRVQGSPSDVSSFNSRVGAITPTSGDYSFSLISGTIAAPQLPTPTGATLGGVQSSTQTTHNFLTYIDTSGVPHFAQPAFTDISGSVAASQLPNPTGAALGGVQSSTQTSHNFLTYIDTSGVPHFAQPAFTDISGSTTAAQTPTCNQTSNNLSDVASVVAAADNLCNKGTNIASATTTDLSTATGQYVVVTGTVTITALGTCAAGVRRFVEFAGALTLTYNATSLIVPSKANIATAAGDCALFISEGSGNWRCLFYSKADGTSLVSSGGGAAPSIVTNTSSTITATIGTILENDTTSNAVTITMPNPSGKAGQSFFYKDTGGNCHQNSTSFAPFSGEKLEFLSGNYVSNGDYAAIEWYTNGTDWRIK